MAWFVLLHLGAFLLDMLTTGRHVGGVLHDYAVAA